jgi:hypothetical protein
MIAFAALVLIAALALPGSALPQALTIGTEGRAGDGSHFVAPIGAHEQSGNSAVAADAGAGSGSAASAGGQNGDDGASAALGCVDGTAVNGDSTLDATAGDCGGSGSAAGAGANRDKTDADGRIGCVDLGLTGSTSGSLEAGSCESTAESAPAGGPGGNGGGSNSHGESSDENASEAGAGVAGTNAGTGNRDSAAPERSGGSGGQRSDSGLCGSIRDLAGLSRPGSVPLWMLTLCTMGAFAAGLLLARRAAQA